MKKTFQANIDNRAYNIDEDAYLLLQDYLDALHKAFPDSDGEEIALDIESRIGEHFQESFSRGTEIITIAEVRDVIGIIGSVEQLTGDPAEENPIGFGSQEPQAVSSEPQESCIPPRMPQTANSDRTRDYTYGVPGKQTYAQCPPRPNTLKAADSVAERKFYRDTDNKIIGGVIGGLSVKFGWNPDAARLIALGGSTLFPGLPFMLFVYCLLWIFIPAASSPKEILQMYGIPVTVDNLSKATLTKPGSDKGSWPGFHRVLKIFARIFAVGAMIFFTITGFMAAFAFIMSVFYITLSNSSEFYFERGYIWISDYAECATLFLSSLSWLILSVAGIWAALSLFYKIHTPKRNIVIGWACVCSALMLTAAIINLVGSGASEQIFLGLASLFLPSYLF